MERENSPDYLVFIVVIVTFAIAATGAFFVFFFPESYAVWNPTIDTVLPEEFADGDFQSLALGTHKDEVLKQLGQPNTVGWKPTSTAEWSYADSEWVYGYDGACSWCDFAWIQYYIYFDEQGKVINKERDIHYD